MDAALAERAVTLAPDAIREVTDAEVAHYQRFGWAKLEGLIKPGVAAAMLARMQARMGVEGDQEVGGGYGVKTPRPPQAKAIFTTYDDPSSDEPLIHAVSFAPAMGRLMSRCVGTRVRFWGDECYIKMPAAKGGGKTPWHQDWPYYPYDRAGCLTVWVALVDIPAEMGTMRFVNGSHLWGPQGRIIGRTDGRDAMDVLPEFLRQRVEISPPLDMKAGDATVHNDLTIHSAPHNSTDKLRWVYTLMAFPADALYTGAPQRRTDDLGLVLNQPLDHPNFPLLPV